jgi:hypothetical protein
MSGENWRKDWLKSPDSNLLYAVLIQNHWKQMHFQLIQCVWGCNVMYTIVFNPRICRNLNRNKEMLLFCSPPQCANWASSRSIKDLMQIFIKEDDQGVQHS